MKRLGYKEIRKSLHKIASVFVGGIYKIFCKIGLFTPKVVVYVDGGICSQMHQYLIGQLYAIQGKKVFYDLNWFKVCGRDVDGKYERVYELETAFPSLNVVSINPFEGWFYRMFLCYTSLDHKLPEICLPPIYLGGYYGLPHVDFVNLFKRFFLDDFVKIKQCSNELRCAIHVRRGDLAKGDNLYYGGTADSYFFNAIAYVKKHYSNVIFYFFSDEMSYVSEQLLPRLSDLKYELVMSNKAYEDLFLIAGCDVIIASQGTFGRFAAMFNEKSLLILKTEPDELYGKYRVDWSARKKNVVYIDE